LQEALPGKRRELSEALLRQVRLPVGARPLRNRRGTAPGLLLESGKSLLVALPGVPDEMRGLWQDEVFPELATRFPVAGKTRRRVVVGGLRESEVDGMAAPVCLRRGVDCTILAGGGVVELHLEGHGEAVISALHELRILLAHDLISCDGSSLEETVLAAARSRGGHLAVAESCTGGRVAARLTAVPGASDVFLGSLVVYSDDLKRGLLDVPDMVLRRHGAASQEAARAMVEGLRRRTGCRWGVAVTGIAGPQGSGRGKPVGSVWFAAAGPAGVVSRRRRFPGGRHRVQDEAAGMALDLLRRTVLSGGSEA
jgi:nicotinamide-nucleotide amidase